jgi:hypothetical protein
MQRFTACANHLLHESLQRFAFRKALLQDGGMLDQRCLRRKLSRRPRLPAAMLQFLG